MNFPNLTQVGLRYRDELGTEGERRPVFTSYANKLLRLQLKLDDARRTSEGEKIATGGVAEKAAFFSRNLVQEREDAERKIRTIQDEIDRFKALLTLQGGVLNADGSINWPESRRVVVYDTTAEQQGLTQLHASNGLLYMDAAHTKLFDTRNMVTAFAGPGWAIYVLSATGKFHASSHSVGYRHHSSLLNQSNVAGAGEMRAHGGRLLHITNKSGHYIPGAAHFVQVLYMLNKMRVDLHKTGLTLISANGKQSFNTVDTFLQRLAQLKVIEADYEFMKLLAYIRTLKEDDGTVNDSPFLRPEQRAERRKYTQMLDLAWRENRWQWHDAVEGPRGFIKEDGTQVPHRIARRWLKEKQIYFRPTLQPAR